MRHLLYRLATRPLPIGIDIGSSGAKIVQMTASMGQLQLRALTRVDVPRDASPEDEGFIDRLVQSICDKAASPAFNTRQCIVAIDDRLLRVRSVRLPTMSEDEVAKAVRLDGHTQLGFHGDQRSVIGWAIGAETSPADGSRREVMYLGAPASPLERLADGLAEGGLRPVGFEPGFIALARCYGRRLRREADRENVKLILDVGDRKTVVLFTRGDRVAFYKSLELGGRDITEAAANRLGMEPETIRDLRGRRASGRSRDTDAPDAKVDRALYEAIRPLMEEIAHEANLCLRHYIVTFRGARPDRCLLSGGDAAEPGLEEIVSDSLHLPTEVARPFEDVGLSPDLHGHGEDVGQFAAWSIAAGLSLQPFHQRSDERRTERRRASDRGRVAASAEPEMRLREAA